MPEYAELRALKRPVWVIGFVIALLAVFVFVNLGLWQLRRLEERRTLNQTIAARLTADPTGLEEILQDGGFSAESDEYRRVRASGTYRVSDEVILLTRSTNGRSGHHVLTPFVTTGGAVALVDRGWVPIDVEGPPTVGAEPPDAQVTIIGVLRRMETRGGLGVPTADGSYRRIGRIDQEILGNQWGAELGPLYLALETQDPDQSTGFPLALEAPEPSEGAHLSYAVQWFIFAGIVLIGFPILARRSTVRRREPHDQTR